MKIESLDAVSPTEQRIFSALLSAAPGPRIRFTIELDALAAAAAEPDEDKICRALMRLAKEQLAVEQAGPIAGGSLIGAIQIVGETVITEISDLAYLPEVRAALLRPKCDA